MVDPAGGHLLVPHQAGYHRKPGRVGGGEPGRTQLVRAQVEHGSATGVPGAVRVRMRIPHLVEPAGAGIHDKDVPVTTGVGAALDGRGARDRVRAAVAVLGVVEGDRYPGLAGRYV